MDTAPTPNSPRAAKRLDMIARLAELDMAVAETVAAAIQRTPDPAPELLLAYTRIARSLRQTLACEARLEQTPTLTRDTATSAHAARRRPEIRREVERAIADAPESDRENLLIDLEERLHDEDLLQTLATAPLRHIVLTLCTELGVQPDTAQMPDAAPNHARARPTPNQAAPPTSAHPEPAPPYFRGRGWPDG